jgi:hypothetical protein
MSKIIFITGASLYLAKAGRSIFEKQFKKIRQ